MKLARTVWLAVIALLLLPVLVAAQIASKDQVRLTTPESPWIVVIDKLADFRTVQIKPDGRSGYFLMYPDSDDLNVSLFIEPAEKCKTSEECRDFVLNAGNPAWGKFQDLAKAGIGNFSYFEFFRPAVSNQPVRMFDMYAQYVSDGYWVDLHISKVLYKKEDHALFERLVRSVRFERKDLASSPRDALSAVRDAADKWLSLLNAGKCKESYISLTSISREAVTEAQWTEYCNRINKELGKPDSRKPVAMTAVRSLPPKPDRSGATLRYQTLFQNRPVIEFISLTTEKDGTWTVSNYRIE